MHPLEVRLADRAQLAGVVLPSRLHAPLLAYYDLLFRWNRTINLTALSDPDKAIDRLLLEPVAAARHLPGGHSLIDLGSGGGSPAIPLALTLGPERFVMVESKVRKAAFLREAVRAVGLNATVESTRFEELAMHEDYSEQFGIASMRAVRMDEHVLHGAARFLHVAGWLALFVTEGTAITLPRGIHLERRARLPGGSELLVCGRDVPRETSPV